VSPLYFFLKNLATCFVQQRHFLLISLGCLEGVTSQLFYLSNLILSTILCKFALKIFFSSGVTPGRVSPGAVRTPRLTLVTPLMYLIVLSLALYLVYNKLYGTSVVDVGYCLYAFVCQ